MKRPYLDPHDHAFANGPVFKRPASIEAARALFDRPEDGERLMELFELFETGAECGSGLRLGLNARLLTPNGERRVRTGRDCAIRGIIRCEGDGRAAIGDEVYVGDGVIVSVRTSVEIGDGTLIAHGAQIFDNDTHPLDAEERLQHFRAILKTGPKGRKPDDFPVAAAPVRIGARCWLGFSSAVMKGVALGDEAIVAAGAVVTADIPARSVAAGNPARVVKSPDGAARPLRPLGRLFGRGEG
jgi:acetyltransferase-like isoleucine patch superfamily enzyme